MCEFMGDDCYRVVEHGANCNMLYLLKDVIDLDLSIFVNQLHQAVEHDELRFPRRQEAGIKDI